MTEAPDPLPAPSPSAAYPALARAVESAARTAARIADPLERARALTALLAALGHETTLVTGERDAAVAELLASGAHPSHRALSRDLGLSRQRVDQLAAHGRRGGRPRREG